MTEKDRKPVEPREGGLKVIDEIKPAKPKKEVKENADNP